MTKLRGVPLAVSPAARRTLWLLLVTDVVMVAWMLSAGEWFDRTSAITSVVTLGGHHSLVLWLAASSFAALLLTAVLTGGFTAADGPTRGIVAAAGGTSLVAVGGMVSVAALIVGVVALTALLGRAFLR